MKKLFVGSFLQCNHLIAYDYFAKSILEPNIVACGCNTYQEFRLFCKSQCTNRAIMGEYVNRRYTIIMHFCCKFFKNSVMTVHFNPFFSARGKFFLDLNL